MPDALTSKSGFEEAQLLSKDGHMLSTATKNGIGSGSVNSSTRSVLEGWVLVIPKVA